MKKLTDPAIKLLLQAGAIIAVGLGLIGAFLPVLPTTPFLILAAALSYNSSPRLRRWLLEHPIFGVTIKDYLQKRTIAENTRRKALVMLWLCLLVSILLVQNIWVTATLLLTGTLVTSYLLRLNGRQQEKESDLKHRNR